MSIKVYFISSIYEKRGLFNNNTAPALFEEKRNWIVSGKERCVREIFQAKIMMMVI